MSIIEAIIFGVVQGITEALPISSTAHIVITQLILGYQFPGLGFEIFLHLASVLAVMIYFRKELWAVINGFFAYFINKSDENRVQFYFGWYLLIATFITGVLGVVLQGVVGEEIKTPTVIAIALFTTGLFLLLIERFASNGTREEKDMKISDAIWVGLAQTLATLPGISRSGTTLLTALWIGLSREAAVRFSFLLAIPVILGSSVLMISDFSMEMINEIGITALIVAFITTFIFSWIGIFWLIDFLRKSRLIYFAVYCFIAAICIYLFVDPVVRF